MKNIEELKSELRNLVWEYSDAYENIVCSSKSEDEEVERMFKIDEEFFVAKAVIEDKLYALGDKNV